MSEWTEMRADIERWCRVAQASGSIPDIRHQARYAAALEEIDRLRIKCGEHGAGQTHLEDQHRSYCRRIGGPVDIEPGGVCGECGWSYERHMRQEVRGRTKTQPIQEGEGMSEWTPELHDEGRRVEAAKTPGTWEADRAGVRLKGNPWPNTSAEEQDANAEAIAFWGTHGQAALAEIERLEHELQAARDAAAATLPCGHPVQCVRPERGDEGTTRYCGWCADIRTVSGGVKRRVPEWMQHMEWTDAHLEDDEG